MALEAKEKCDMYQDGWFGRSVAGGGREGVGGWACGCVTGRCEVRQDKREVKDREKSEGGARILISTDGLIFQGIDNRLLALTSDDGANLVGPCKAYFPVPDWLQRDASPVGLAVIGQYCGTDLHQAHFQALVFPVKEAYYYTSFVPKEKKRRLAKAHRREQSFARVLRLWSASPRRW